MYKELNTYFPHGLEGDGIFKAIAGISWFPGVVPENVDTYFMLKHGEKLASKVCDKFADDDGIIQGAKLRQLAQVIHNAYIVNWEHEYKTLTVEYNPIENTDFVETIKDKTHKDTEGNNITTGKTTTSNEDVTTGSYSNSNVTTGKFENADITTGKYENADITTGKFENADVTTGKVNNVDVTTGKTTKTDEVNVAGFDSATNVPQSDSSSTTDYTGDGTDPMTVNRTTDYTGDGTDPMTLTRTTDYTGDGSDPLTVNHTTDYTGDGTDPLTVNHTTNYTGDGTDPLTVTLTTDYGSENSNPLTVKSSSTVDYGTKSGTPLTVDATGSEDGTYERELRRHGNIGVTTNAQMISSDIDVWKLNNFYDILCSDICKVIALSIF